jgi:hypothetical protein
MYEKTIFLYHYCFRENNKKDVTKGQVKLFDSIKCVCKYFSCYYI